MSLRFNIRHLGIPNRETSTETARQDTRAQHMHGRDCREPSDISRSSDSSTIDRIEDIERSMEQLALAREQVSARGRLPPRTESLRLVLAGRGASPNMRVHAGRRAAAAALPSRPAARLSDTSSSSSRHSASDSERYSGRDVPARPREVSTADREVSTPEQRCEVYISDDSGILADDSSGVTPPSTPTSSSLESPFPSPKKDSADSPSRAGYDPTALAAAASAQGAGRHASRS